MPNWFENEEFKKQIPIILSPKRFDMMRPVWVASTLGNFDKEVLKARLQGHDFLDLYLTNQAIINNKAIGGVETAQEQCSVFNNLNKTMVS